MQHDDRGLALSTESADAAHALSRAAESFIGQKLDTMAHVSAALEADPGDRRSIEEWARIAAASARTLTRGFHRETGMSFGAWRQQLRLLRAIERLAAREPVTSVAMSVGYDSLSAFVRLFKRSFGVPPSRYFGPAAAERREA